MSEVVVVGPASFSLKEKKLISRKERERKGKELTFAQRPSCATYFMCNLPSHLPSTNEENKAQRG